jgi:septation ring formation regulator EzrA
MQSNTCPFRRARPSPERLEARIWSLEKKQETVIDLVQDMKNQNSDLKQAVKDLKDEYGDLIRQVKVSKLPPFFNII